MMPDVLQTLGLNIRTSSLWMEAHRMILLLGRFSTSVRTLKEPLQSTVKVVFFFGARRTCSYINLARFPVYGTISMHTTFLLF